MTLDPRIGFWFSIAMAVLALLAGSGAQLTDLGMSAGAEKAVLAVITLLLGVGNAINAVLHAIPSASTPAAQKDFYLGPKGGSA